MRACDALVVGGGPAGSTCARALARAGLDVVVLDKAVFPRDKLCAGWITPGVVELLELDLAEYGRGHTLQPITGFRTSVMGRRAIETRYDRPVSFGILRSEFDAYLLRRSGVRLELGDAVESIRRADGRWIVNDRIRASMLVGAGGHFCPVAGLLNPRSSHERIVAAREVECPVGTVATLEGAGRTDPETPELFFCPDFKGYGWCFRKGRHVNVGFGRLHGDEFSREVEAFGRVLEAEGIGGPGYAGYSKR